MNDGIGTGRSTELRDRLPRRRRPGSPGDGTECARLAAPSTESHFRRRRRRATHRQRTTAKTDATATSRPAGRILSLIITSVSVSNNYFHFHVGKDKTKCPREIIVHH